MSNQYIQRSNFYDGKSKRAKYAGRKKTERQERVENVNALIKFIGDRGRFFFRKTFPFEEHTYCRFLLKENRLWLQPEIGGNIYTGYKYWDKKLPHGGTLKQILRAFKDYIMTKKKVPNNIFGPFPDWLCGGDPWGYGIETMEEIKNEAIKLGICEG